MTCEGRAGTNASGSRDSGEAAAPKPAERSHPDVLTQLARRRRRKSDTPSSPPGLPHRPGVRDGTAGGCRKAWDLNVIGMVSSERKMRVCAETRVKLSEWVPGITVIFTTVLAALLAYVFQNRSWDHQHQVNAAEKEFESRRQLVAQEQERAVLNLR